MPAPLPPERAAIIESWGEESQQFKDWRSPESRPLKD
jgi:hypothetical protein